MPTYDYFCSKCEQSFELVQSMKDPRLEVCPEAKCRLPVWGKGCVKRQMGTGAGLIFKGSGFYITDYRSENYKEGAKKEAPAAGGSGGDAAKPKAEAPAAPASPKAEPAKTSPPPASTGTT